MCSKWSLAGVEEGGGGLLLLLLQLLLLLLLQVLAICWNSMTLREASQPPYTSLKGGGGGGEGGEGLGHA